MRSEQTDFTKRQAPTIRRLGLTAAPALMAGLLLSGTALAGGLFEPVTAAELAVASRSGPVAADAASGSFARLNRAELEAHVALLGIDRAPERARQARALDGRVEMTLSPGVAVDLLRSDVSRVPGGGVLWSADVAGGDGTGSFLVEHGQMFGVVDVGGTTYKVEPVADDLHRITEIDPKSLRGDIVVPAPDDQQSQAAHDGSSAEPTILKAIRRTKIRYLVAYTKKAKAAAFDVEQEIKFAIAWTNQAFKNSKVKIKFKLVKTMLARGYDEDLTTYSGNLSDLRNGFAFNKVRRKRNRTEADLVALVREGGAFCGVGYYTPRPTALNSDIGFQVTSRDCMPSTFAHEAGHNMGLNHDRYVASAAGNDVYNFGFVNLAATTRTIMAYNSECVDNATSCTRVQFFSTPKKTPNSVQIGVPQGQVGASDAARQLNENRKGVASYR